MRPFLRESRPTTAVSIPYIQSTKHFCAAVASLLRSLSCSLCRMPQHDWSLAHDAVIISRQYYVNCTGYIAIRERIKFKVACLFWFANRCLGRRLSTWQMTAVLFLTAPNAHCGQRTFRLAWCHEHSAAITVTELLQPQDPACGTLFQSNYAIRTSPTDCWDDSWRHTFVTFFGKHEQYGALWLLYAAP